MHPILTDRRWLVLHLLVWGVAGETIGLLIRTVFETSWTASLAFGMPMGMLGGVMSLSAWYVSRATPVQWTQRVRPIATWLLAALVTALIWAGLGVGWWRLLERLGVDSLREIDQQEFVAVLRGLGGLGYLFAVAAYRVVQAFEATAAATARALQSEVAQREAEIRALRAQLDPHFLFNSLNSVVGLIGPAPDKAREMCQRLGDFLRQTLRVHETGRIPLSGEVALAEQYLKVEQVRFGSRLQLQLSISPETLSAAVPPLLLQPLVENAVRHGIATMIEGGTVAIETRLADERVIIVVTNPRDPDATRRGTGLGLDIVRRRLAAVFGDRASLAVEAGNESYRVSITIPREEV